MTIHVRRPGGFEPDVLAATAVAAVVVLAMCAAALLVDVVAGTGSHLAAAGVGMALDAAAGTPLGYHWRRRPVCTVVVDPQEGEQR